MDQDQKDSQVELVLYYGLKNEHEEKLLNQVLSDLGISGKKIDPEEIYQSVGSLAGLSSQAACPADESGSPAESIVVMHGLSDDRIRQFLQAIRQADGLEITLKAVITDQNRSWSFAALAAELRREHTAMQLFMRVRNLVSQAGVWLKENQSDLSSDPDKMMYGEMLAAALQQAGQQLDRAGEQGELDLESLSSTGKEIATLFSRLLKDSDEN